MSGIAAQPEMATSDVVKFVVEELQDRRDMAAAMLYCNSLSELRDHMITYEKARQVTMFANGRTNQTSQEKQPVSNVTGLRQKSNETCCYN